MKSFLSSMMLLAAPISFAPLGAAQYSNTTCPGLPSGYTAPVDTYLPDPFTNIAGTKITTVAQWACRKEEIRQFFYKYEIGDKPDAPTTVTGTVSSTAVTVTATYSGKSISFTAPVTMPAGATGPVPVIIAYDGASIPIPSNIATITYNVDDIAAQVDSTSRGVGKFYTLYGSNSNAGAVTAWAWGLSRIIDVLVADTTKRFDTTKIGVTGCSRDGKGAFFGGALDDRVALTIPQESGSGGAACWRISDTQHAAGANIQTAGEIVGENVWFSTLFNQWSTKTTYLPHDHHMLAALIVPRGLFVIENNIDWLGPVSTTGCMRVGELIYQAFNASDHMGFSETTPHNHCAFPSSQQAQLTAFLDKFLLGKSDSTSGIDQSDQSVTAAQYINWSTPILTQ